MRRILRRIHFLLNRRRLERELDEEMAAHREMMAADRRKAFGSPLRLREEARDAWGWSWLDDLRQDLRQGVRGFLRDRRVTVSALAAIGLAVGAATAVFSVVDRSLFRSLPYRDGDRLVSIGLILPAWGPAGVMFAGAYRDWKSSQTALDLASWSGVGGCDVGEHSPRRLQCGKAEADFLPLLGVQPLLGRHFSPEEDRPDGEPVALLSFRLWQAQFGGNPDAVGRRIAVDGSSVRIVGILPAAFETPDLTPADLLLPQRLARERVRNVEIKVVGRLRAGHTVESAAAALDPLFQLFRADFGFRVGDSFAKTMRFRITRLRDEQVAQYRAALWLLLGAAAALVSIACANVAHLLLARSAARQREFAIRTALGASKPRLARQMLAECAALALSGGALGCALAWWLLRLSVALAPDGALRLREAALDTRVLVFALLLSAATALLFGVGPSLRGLRGETLAGGRTVGRRRGWLSHALIAGQISLSLVLLTAASLLLLSLWRLQHSPLGFVRERVLTASLTLPPHRYPDEPRQTEFFRRLEESLRQLPGAVASAIADTLPPGPPARSTPLHDASGSAVVGNIGWRYVTPGYFEALGIPIQRGRSFTDSDRDAADSPVILSESLWRTRYGGAEPVGGRLGARRQQFVIGVAADVRNQGLAGPPSPEFYVLRKRSGRGIPGAGDPTWPRHAMAILRTSLPESAAAESFRAAIQNLDPMLPVKVETMSVEVDRFLVRPRFQTVVLILFATAGVLLAGIGLYGLISYLVARRTREIGVRMALGAGRGDVLRMVLSDAAAWTVAGSLIGCAASAASLRVFQTLLYGVSALDSRAFVAAGAILFAVAALAAWIPARSATKIDPMSALREE